MGWKRIFGSIHLEVSLSLGFWLLGFAQCALAQSPELVQAAKKEGEVVVFGSLENDVAAAINKGFET